MVLLYLHWEVVVSVVVLQNVANSLIEHGKERAQGSESGEVHDVLLGEGVLQGTDDQGIRGEVWGEDVSTVRLDLQYRHGNENKKQT